jgi:hypothetical protein
MTIEKLETFISETERIIVIGDLHGDTAMLCSCLYMTNVINTNMEWVANPPNTIVLQIGDQLDSLVRGGVVDNWEKLDDTTLMRFTDKLDTIAKKQGGRFISMLGNHEVMNVFGDYSYVSPTSLEKSGGLEGRKSKFRPAGTYSTLLSKRPSVLKIGDLVFCHAGLLPHHLDLVDGNLQKINDLNQRFFLGKEFTQQEITIHKELFVNPMSLLWNRIYIEGTHSVENTAIMENVLDSVLQRTNSVAMIIGHNPLEHITPLYNLKLWVTDVGLSRSFPTHNIEVLEILNGNKFNVIKAIT